MAEAAGWGVIPVSMSFGDSVRKLAAELNGPVAKAAKNAGQSIEKEVGGAASKAASAYEKAKYRQKKAAEELTGAEASLSQQQSKSRAAALELQAAESKLESLRSSGNASAEQIAKAEAQVERRRAASEKSADDLRKSELKLQSAQEEVATASKRLEDRLQDVKTAQNAVGDETEETSSKFAGFRDQADGLADVFSDIAGKAAGFAGAFAGAASIGGFVTMGRDAADSISLMNRQLGNTGDVAALAGEEVGETLRSGLASSAEEAAESIGALQGQFKYLGFEGEQTAAELSDNFLAFSKTFGVDMAEATQTAGQLITNGLATDVENAADLMTVAMQKVPAQMRDELPEIINEYGTNFRALGFDGEEAFGLLVGAAEKGKWALDKTGDSLKEFTIRGSDMSKTSIEAYEALGLNAEEMSRKIAAGGDGAQDALQQTAQKLLAMEDPAERANTAIALFGTPLEDLSVDQIPQFLQSLSGAETAMGDVSGASQQMADDMSNSLGGRLDALKGTVSDLAGDAFMKLWDVMSDIGSFAQDNWSWVGPLSVGLGTLAGVVSTLATGILVYRGAVAASTAVQAAFNATLLANPITWVVAAVAGLVAGLVLFFTKTETGRQMWEKFTTSLKVGWDGFVAALSIGWAWVRDNVFTPFMSFMTGTVWPVMQQVWGGIKAAWDGFVNALQWAWTSIIQPVLNAFWQFAQVTIGVIATVILAPLLLAWQALSNGIQWAWTTLIQPALSAFANFATTVLWPALQSAFQWVSDKWNWLSGMFSTVWNWLQTSVFTPLVNWFTMTLWPTVQNILTWVVDKWNWLKDILFTVATWFYDNVIMFYVRGFQFLWDKVQAVLAWIVDKWNWAKDMLHSAWLWIDANVLGGFRRGLEGFKSFFGDVVNGIRSVWDSLRSALAKPINFMINTVYNGGILKAWNTIAKFLPGLKEAAPLAGIPEHATGGRIMGPGTGTSDDVLMWGSNGEHMLTADDVRDMGGHGAVYAMREALQSGRGFTFDGNRLALLPQKVDNKAGDLLGAAPELFPKYKDGGEVKPMWEHQLERAHKWARARHGRPYVLGGSADGGGGTDCSGFMSGIADVIGGGTGARQWATMAFNGGGNSQHPSGPQGFVAGVKAHTLSIGVTNGGAAGGHTAGTLGATSSIGPVNVESGGWPSMVKYGDGAVGATDPYFTTHYHLPIGPGGAFVVGKGSGGPSPEEMQKGIKDKISSLVDKAMNPIIGQLPKGPPAWQDIPKGYFDKGKKSLLDGSFKMVGELGDKLASVWTAASEVKDLVSGAVKDAASFVNDKVADVFTRDQGGIVPDGAYARNTSGKDELMLPPSTTALFNKFLKDMPGVSGALERAAVAWQDAAEELDLEGTVRKSAEDYATEQGKGLLGMVGLEGLIPMGVKLGEQAWDAYQANPIDVAMTQDGVVASARNQGITAAFGRGGATVTIEAESDKDMVRVGQLQQLAGRIDGLEVKVARKPKAATLTKGGVM